MTATVWRSTHTHPIQKCIAPWRQSLLIHSSLERSSVEAAKTKSCLTAIPIYEPRTSSRVELYGTLKVFEIHLFCAHGSFCFFPVSHSLSFCCNAMAAAFQHYLMWTALVCNPSVLKLFFPRYLTLLPGLPWLFFPPFKLPQRLNSSIFKFSGGSRKNNYTCTCMHMYILIFLGALSKEVQLKVRI